jgi:hypothetical protein
MHPFTNTLKNNVQLFNQRIGLPPDAHLGLSAILKKAQQEKKDLIFSENQFESDIPMARVSIDSIRHLKSLAGLPDGIEDAHIAYPPPLDRGWLQAFGNAGSRLELDAKMDDPFYSNVRKARDAYLLGNSRKVLEYEPIIDSLLFPSVMTVFTGEELNIPAGEVYTIKGDGVFALNFEQITLGKGAEMKITPGTIINAQSITQL